MQKNKSFDRLIQITSIAMLSAVGFVLMLLEFILLPAAPHLKMDFSDLPAVLGGVLFGPVYGVLIELIKNVIEMLVKGLGTQLGFGNLQNFLIGISYVIPISVLFRYGEAKQSRLAHAAALAVPVFSIVVVGVLSNLLVTPLFFRYFLQTQLTQEAVWSYVMLTIPFNAIKGVILSVLSALLFRWALMPIRKVAGRASI